MSQERITETPDSSTIVVQYNAGGMHVGIGFEQFSPVPEMHIVDSLYGTSVREIGEILAARLDMDRKIDVHEGYRNANNVDMLNDELGRFVLDAVTGSKPNVELMTWISRPSVNRLIRLLRKARDVSFGKDE